MNKFQSPVLSLMKSLSSEFSLFFLKMAYQMLINYNNNNLSYSEFSF